MNSLESIACLNREQACSGSVAFTLVPPGLLRLADVMCVCVVKDKTTRTHTVLKLSVHILTHSIKHAGNSYGYVMLREKTKITFKLPIRLTDVTVDTIRLI